MLYAVGMFAAILLLAASAFLSAAESAFFHLPKPAREELEESRDTRAGALLFLLGHPRRLTMLLRLLNLLVRVVLVAWITFLTLRLSGELAISRPLFVLAHLVVLLLLIVGPTEVIPRAYGISHAERTALSLARPMRVLDRVLAPGMALLVRILQGTARFLGVRWAVPYLTAEDVIAVVEAGEEGGEIEEEEREMIHSILELGDTAVREVMVPRVDMIAVERKSPIEEALAKITEEGHSRIPVYDGSVDRIVGVVYAKDLLRADFRSSLGLPVERVMREPFFVPEGKRVDDLLREFQREKVHLAIVVDEYGGTAGLVTMEDLLEEIVGEIQDEYDREDDLFEAVGPDAALVNAKIDLDELNERFDIGIPTERHDTLGGYLYDLIDRVPEEGESFEDPESRLLFKIEKVDRQRIARVRIRRLPPPPGDEKPGE
ncbi:MAG: HlyC/CorC family transporter [Candidatus Latescibacterota bacterium]|nr:MAG: HlyC/CorC family transporter [Candidatus Latescibacterota bacterium]